MKVSSYNIFIENKKYNNWLLFNTKSCCLLEVNKDIMDFIEEKSQHSGISEGQIAEDVLQELKDCYIIIDSDIDELQDIIRDDENVYKRISDTKNFIDLTICPTLNCNLRCTYCYEIYHSDSINYGVMSDYVQNKVIEVYENHCERNKNGLNNEQRIVDSITWYGGEPLLSVNVIKNIQTKINEIAKKHNRKLRNSITTNGILLNQKNQNILRESEIKDIQISIDGPKEIHNKRRYYPKYPLLSFDTIVNNLHSLDEYFRVMIRINTDRENYKYVNELVDELVQRKIWPKKNVSIDIANVKCTLNNSLEYAIPHEEFAQIERNFRLHKLAVFNEHNKDKKAKLKLEMPTLSKTGCRIAVNKNANVIGPKGEIYSCWSNVGNKKYVVGHIEDIIKEKEFTKKLISTITPEVRKTLGCYSCKIFPTCSIICQESFIRDGAIHPPFLCSKWKRIIEETLLFNYDFEKKYPELSKKTRD